MGKQQVVLEDEANLAALDRQVGAPLRVIKDALIQLDSAFIRRHQARNRPQNGGLT